MHRIEEKMAENASKISEHGKELYKRLLTFTEHFDGIKRGLEQSIEAYNKSVGSLETRVLPSARKFEELGIQTKKTLDSPSQIDKIPREISL